VTRRTLLALCASPLAAQQGGLRDDTFSDLPVDRWLTHSDEAHIRWNSHISEPRLSTHQRLIVSLTAEVDGAELSKRRGKGRFLILAQVTDARGTIWQGHLEIALDRMEEGLKSNNVDFTILMFALPGDYEIALAIWDDATSEHSVRRHHLHVSPLRNDPLPAAWQGLPAVEFIPVLEPPEKWYLPSIEGRLSLAASAHEPHCIDLVVNLTASAPLAGSTQAQTRIFEVLLPAAKVFSQVNWGSSPFGFTLLDLSRNRVVYQQEEMGPVDWSRAGASLKDVNAGTIDAHALEQQWLTANFFVSEIRRRIRSAASQRKGKPPVVIVLSSAFRFAEVQTLQPVDHDLPYAAKVFYIRYQPLPRLLIPALGSGVPPRRADYRIEDQLAPLLKPLEPRIFEIATQDELRKALAAILSEISRM